MNPTINLIEPKPYVYPTKNLIEPKLYMNPNKNLIYLGTHMPDGERRKLIDIEVCRAKVKVTTAKNGTKI